MTPRRIRFLPASGTVLIVIVLVFLLESCSSSVPGGGTEPSDSLDFSWVLECGDTGRTGYRQSAEVGPGADFALAWTFTPAFAPMDATGGPFVYRGKVYATFFVEEIYGSWDDVSLLVALDANSGNQCLELQEIVRGLDMLAIEDENLILVNSLAERVRICSLEDGRFISNWIDVSRDKNLFIWSVFRLGSHLYYLSDRIYKQKIGDWDNIEYPRGVVFDDFPNPDYLPVPVEEDLLFLPHGIKGKKGLVAYNLTEERIEWERPGNYGKAIVKGNKLYISVQVKNDEQHALCLEADTGKVLWESEVPISSVQALCDRQLITTRISINNENGARKALFQSLNSETGRLEWLCGEADGIRLPLVGAGDIGYFATRDGWFRAISLKDGRLIKEIALPENYRPRGHIALAKGKAFLRLNHIKSKRPEIVACIASVHR